MPVAILQYMPVAKPDSQSYLYQGIYLYWAYMFIYFFINIR